MMHCKSMTTPMGSNVKLLSDVSLDSVDVSLDDWVLDVPDEHETRYFLFCEHIEPIPDGFETCSLDSWKAYSEVPKGYD